MKDFREMSNCREMNNCAESNCGGSCSLTEDMEEVASNSYPAYTMLCQDCQHEFKLETSEEEVGKSVCPTCQSANVKNLYVSFPEDGPGFRKKVNGFSFGGCN